MTGSVLIIDFGSQVTQLIARRVRETGVYCEIHPFQSAASAFAKMRPDAVILSGGPASVTEDASPRAPAEIFSAGIPVLGICYGQQTMAEQLGGKVESGHHREFGRALVEVKSPSLLFEGVWAPGEKHQATAFASRACLTVSASSRSARMRRLRPCRTKRAASMPCSSTRRSCTRRTARG